MLYINPFTPGRIPNNELFTGRTEILNRFERSLKSLKNEMPINLLVYGERGIGKSTILKKFNDIACGKITNSDGLVENFLSLKISISKKSTIESLITSLNYELERKISQIEKFKDNLKKIWEFTKQIRIDLLPQNWTTTPLN